MGSVVTGKYPLSLSQWVPNTKRKQVAELLNCYSDRPLLAVKIRPPAIDLMLFVRPFRSEAWVATLIMIVVLIIMMLAPFLWNSSYDRSDSSTITQTSGWYFFVLFNAFYGGALTMFFTSSQELQFSTIREVMQTYPGEVVQSSCIKLFS